MPSSKLHFEPEFTTIFTTVARKDMRFYTTLCHENGSKETIVEFLWTLANAEKPRNQATFRENLRDEKSLVYLPRHYVIHTVGPIWNIRGSLI